MNIDVTRHNVKILEDKEDVHENEYNITNCNFIFDEYTDSFPVKRAIFTILSTGEMYETDIIENKCIIPQNVLKHEYETIKLGVYGYEIETINGENYLKQRVSPSYDTFIVNTGSYKEGAESPTKVTPSQYDLYSQALQEGLKEVDDKVDEVIEVVDSKIVEIDEAIERTNNLDLDANKVGKITSIIITKKDGTQKEVTLEDGMGLDYVWRGTFLGIKREDETEYQYVDLQGPRGEPGAIHIVIVEELPQTGQEDTIYLLSYQKIIVQELPTENIQLHTIYIVESTGKRYIYQSNQWVEISADNQYIEYIYVNNKWEELGGIGIEIDLSNYYTKQEVDSRIPTSLSQLSSDSTHRTVSDTEKSTWNNKSDFSGNYNDLTNKPNIPTKTSDLTNDSDFTTNAYVDGLVGDIATTLDTIQREVI